MAALVELGWAVRRACAVVGISHATWYRRRGPTPLPVGGIRVPHALREYPNRVSVQEAEAFKERVNSEDYVDLSVSQAWRRMLDDGEYHFSLPTAHRIMARAGMNGDRRAQGSAGGDKRSKPVLEATAPNQLWCWDITDLKGPGRQVLKLYTVMDVFSRKVVAHRVERRETAALAADLIERSVMDGWAAPAVLHADNGSAMRAAGTYELMRTLGIRGSHSRPRTSNDNPYIESLFKTVKYALAYPGSFESLQQARTYCGEYFTEYNQNHRHSGLNGYTPQSVHDGSWPTLRHHRQQTLDTYYREHPERHRRRPIAGDPPARAWINKPNQELSQTA
jgi:transposase InsO family protein